MITMTGPPRIRLRILPGRAIARPADSGQCQAVSRGGRRCRLAAYGDSPYCLLHTPAPGQPDAAT